MSVSICEVRPGTYFDSVVLMQLQQALSELPGIDDAGVVMATPANLDLLLANDMPVDSTAGPDDLLIVVKAVDQATGQQALAQVDELLARRRSQSRQTFRPRSLAMGVRQLPEARWVLISVPGRYAAGVAREALELGKHVFLYSDNVDLQDEVELKQLALEKGLLLMGPDCGTAVIDGAGLGFANRVRRGNVGLVAASGTGLQAISVRLHRLGVGLSQGIGTGGRDLAGPVEAITMRQGLELLSHDPSTRVIVLVSKPPEPEVAAKLLAAAGGTGKPVVIYFIGFSAAARRLGNLHFASSLSDAAEIAAGLVAAADAGPSIAEDPAARPPVHRADQRFVRGLFSGGTLAYEFLLGIQSVLSPVYSNISVRDSLLLGDVTSSQAHTIVDMGEDAFTQGRLHPMMDNDLRIRRLRREAADAEVGLIVLDVVLGEGAHPDPASELAPEIEAALAAAKAADRPLEIAALVVGTDEDPQDIAAQIKRLEQAGAVVYQTVEELITHVIAGAGQHEGRPRLEVDAGALQSPIAAVNVGLEMFYDSLIDQGVRAVHVDWRPPAGGNEKLMALLARMKSGSAAPRTDGNEDTVAGPESEQTRSV